MSTRILLTSATQASSNYWILERNTTDVITAEGFNVDSLQNSYFINTNNTTGGVLLTKVNSSGVVQFVKQADLIYPMAISAADVLYFPVVATNVDGTAQFLKTDTSGNITTQLTYTNDRSHYDIQVDSSNSAFVSGYYNSGANPAIYKYSSAGATTFIRYFTFGASTSPSVGRVAVDSSGNFYCLLADYNTSGVTGCHLVKYNNTGTYQWQRRPTSGTNSFYNSTCLTDSASNVYIVATGENSSSGVVDVYIFKINTSGTLQWQKRFPDVSPNIISAAVDSSDNTYTLVVDSPGNMYVIKYNSSGIMQWQRKFGLAVPFSYNFYSMTICVKGSSLIICYAGAVYASPTYTITGLIKYPTDGSITGTFDKYTIESTSISDTTPSYTLSTTATFTSNNATDATTSTTTLSFATGSISTSIYSIG